MKLLLLSLLLLCSLSCPAARTTLSDGRTSAYWDDRTAPVAYEGYRVQIKLTDSYQKNVWGTVSLMADNKCVASKNFMINAGDTGCYVDFDNLTDGTTYDIKVDIRGK